MQRVLACEQPHGLPTGQSKTWTAHRVSPVRMVNDILAYRSAHKQGEWLTMSEVASQAGCQQPPNLAPHQGRIAARRAGRSTRAVPDSRKRSAGPTDDRRRRPNSPPVSGFSENQIPMFQALNEVRHYGPGTDQIFAMVVVDRQLAADQVVRKRDPRVEAVVPRLSGRAAISRPGMLHL